MNTNKHINSSHPNNKSSKLINKVAQVSAKISLRFGFFWQEFVEYYKKNLILEAKKENKNYSIVELSCRTGIDRRNVSHYIKTQELQIKPSKIKMILDRIRLHCNQNNINRIKKSGPFQTFESICLLSAHGTLTPNAIATELLRQGNITEKGDYFYLKEWKYTPDHSDAMEHLRILALQMDHITNTIIYNSDQQDSKEKQFQRNIFSTQIPPQNQAIVKEKISKIMATAINDMDNVIVENEDSSPSCTYKPFGASLFVFGYESNKSK
jgi:hypothetical protein